jgi:hypothetical protein
MTIQRKTNQTTYPMLDDDKQKKADSIRHAELTALASEIFHARPEREREAIIRYFADIRKESEGIDYKAPVGEGLPASKLKLTGYADKVVLNIIRGESVSTIAPESESAKPDDVKEASKGIRGRKTKPAPQQAPADVVHVEPVQTREELPAPSSSTETMLARLLALTEQNAKDNAALAERLTAMEDSLTNPTK